MSRPLYPLERPGIYCIEGCMDPQGLFGRVQKISPRPGFDPPTVHSGESDYMV